MTQFRVGIDIGGTFTDIVFMGEDSRVIVTKVSSSIENYSSAIIRGVSGVMAESIVRSNFSRKSKSRLTICARQQADQSRDTCTQDRDLGRPFSNGTPSHDHLALPRLNCS